MTLSMTDLAFRPGMMMGLISSGSSSRAEAADLHRQYKLAILEEYDEADAQDRGALLRRERLLTSHISEWRKAARAGP